MITYYRDNHNAESLSETYDHVRQTLSAMASDTDDPHEFESEVKIVTSIRDEGQTVRITGTLDREPTKYELPDDYVEPVENQPQRGFGERILSQEELRAHLEQKGIQL